MFVQPLTRDLSKRHSLTIIPQILQKSNAGVVFAPPHDAGAASAEPREGFVESVSERLARVRIKVVAEFINSAVEMHLLVTLTKEQLSLGQVCRISLLPMQRPAGERDLNCHVSLPKLFALAPLFDGRGDGMRVFHEEPCKTLVA